MSAPFPDNRSETTPCAPPELAENQPLPPIEPVVKRSTSWVIEQRSLAIVLLIAGTALFATGYLGWRYWQDRPEQTDEQERRAAIDLEIALALADVQKRIDDVSKSEDPEENAVTLAPGFITMEHVEELVRDGKASEEQQSKIVRTHQELKRVYQDSVTIAEFDEIRLDSIDARERRIDTALLASRYENGFANFEIEARNDRVFECANILRRHRYRERLLTALSNWRNAEPNQNKQFTLGYLLRITEAKDSYRSRMRDALLRRDDMLIKSLLKSPELLKQPPIYLCRLSERLRSFNRELQAVQVLEIGVHRYPGDFWLNVELGGVWLNRKPNGAATAREFFKAAVAIRPDCAGANYLLGVAAQRSGQYVEAACALTRAIQHDAEFADAYLQLSAVLRSQNDLDGAIQYGRRAVEVAPNKPVPLVNLALTFLAQDNLADAKDCYRKAIAADAGYMPALLGLGELLRVEGRFDEARSVLKRATDAAPDDSKALNQYGLLLQAQGDFHSAAERFRKAIDADRLDPAPCVSLGTIKRKLGDREAARWWFERALHRDPKHTEALIELALDHLVAAQYADAIKRLEQAIDYAPRSAVAHFHLGRVRSQNGDPSGAFEAFTRAAEIRPSWIEAQFLRGQMALRLENFEEAAESLQRAKLLCPIDNPLWGPVYIYWMRAKQGMQASS